MMPSSLKNLASNQQESSGVMKRRAALLSIAAAALCGLAVNHPSYGAYQLTNTITASTISPYITTDTTGQNVNYSGIALSNFVNPAAPNGPYNTGVVGYVSGKFTSPNGTVLPSGVSTGDLGGTAYSAFYYNASGFQLVGKYTTTSTGSYGQTNVNGVDASGRVLGGESRSASNSTSTGVLGSEVWLSTPTSASTASDVYLGLFGPNNSYTATYADTNGFSNDTGTYSSQSAIGLTSGYAIGTSQRYAGDNVNAAAVGQILSQFTSHGITTNTLVGSNSSLGQSGWVETSAGVPTEVGLTGSGNSYTLATPASLNGGVSYAIGTYYSNSVNGVNASGIAYGSSQAYSNAASNPGQSLGQDGYIYNGLTSAAVGMYNSGQTLSIPGYGGGAASTFNYYYSPTTNVGITPSTSQGRSTSLRSINSSGVVTGTASYYPVGATSSSSQGQVAFVYNGSTYTTLGFTTNNFPSSAYPLPVGVTSFVNGGPSYIGQTSSNVQGINSAGTMMGTSTTYVGQGNNSSGASNPYTNSGSAAWSSTPTGVLTQIGLYNQGPTAVITQAAGTANAGYSATYNVHQNPSTFGTYSDVPSLINSSGLIAGAAQRYTSTGSGLGADGWVYDPNAGPGGTTYPIDPTDEGSLTGYTIDNLLYLSDSGYLVGEFKTSSSGNYTAFVWTDAAPTAFTVLNGVDVSGLSTAGFQSLIESVYSANPGSPIYVVGSTGASASNTITGLGTLTGSVPEPTTLSLLGIASLGLLSRRRKA